jgi:hypothetical protein
MLQWLNNPSIDVADRKKQTPLRAFLLERN